MAEITSLTELLEEHGDTKLTDWDNEPKVRDLKHDYEEARNAHMTHEAEVERWLDNLFVTGSAKIPKVKGHSTIVPKLIRKQAEWRYAALSEPFLSNDTVFKTEPVTWEDKQAAIQNGLVLNYQFNTKIGKVKFIDEYVRTAVNEGTVVVRVGWEYEEDERVVEEPVMGMQPVADPQKAQQMMAQGIPPMEEVEVSTKSVRKQVVTKNQPSVEVCAYNDVLIDPTCQGNTDNANFIIYQFETSMSDLEKSGKYSNLEHIDIESNTILNEPDSHIDNDYKTFNFKDKPRKRFVAYEYWGYWDIDNSGKTKPIVATWVGDVMIRMEESPFPDGKLPFVVVQYLPRVHSVFGEPDGELLEDNQKIMGAVTRGMIDIMGRSAAGQKAIRQDALDVTNRRKFEAGQDYEFNAHVDPRQAFYDHNYPEIPNSAQFMVQMQNLDAESLTGVKAFHTGITGDALGKTVGTARSAMDAAGKRELGILRRLAEGMKQIGRKIMAMNGQFLSEEEIIRVTNENFVTIKRDDLAGEIDIHLDISTAEHENAKAQELAFMLQTMGNNMPQDLSQVILSDIARLRKMPDLAKRIAEFQPQPDPMQQQMAQLEMQKLQAEVMKLQAEAQKIQADGMLDMAKVDTENAKAGNLQAEKDARDLDFLEEESGTKHQRELEKSMAQAKGNIEMHERDAQNKAQLEVLKSLMKRDEQPRTGSQAAGLENL